MAILEEQIIQYKFIFLITDISCKWTDVQHETVTVD